MAAILSRSQCVKAMYCWLFSWQWAVALMPMGWQHDGCWILLTQCCWNILIISQSGCKCLRASILIWNANTKKRVTVYMSTSYVPYGITVRASKVSDSQYCTHWHLIKVQNKYRWAKVESRSVGQSRSHYLRFKHNHRQKKCWCQLDRST